MSLLSSITHSGTTPNVMLWSMVLLYLLVCPPTPRTTEQQPPLGLSGVSPARVSNNGPTSPRHMTCSLGTQKVFHIGRSQRDSWTMHHHVYIRDLVQGDWNQVVEL
mmetsp:Transcript_17852/g.36928  ORF Transcript_17852/g.36928 Transcript_17852/m.36928 type:complete len:106 (-) Transcript_17852:158-475(-)